MAISESQLYYETTRNFISHLKHGGGAPRPPEVLAQELFEQTVAAVEAANLTLPKTQRIKTPRNLEVVQIAEMMLYCYHIRRISCTDNNADKENDLLGVYQDSGPAMGTYLTGEDDFRILARRFSKTVTTRDMAEILVYVKDNAVRVKRSQDPDLIAVNNGIFDYSSKTLLPFDPDKIFLAKSHVDYNPNAQNVVIHNPDDGTDWDVESWIRDLTDDDEITELIWQVLGAIIRPFVKWNKSAWLYSTSGNNGKGTLCHLMRNLCGEGSWASVSISDFAKDFMLEPLTRATAIIVDENDVGAYIDKAANLKAVITNDVLLINRKFKEPISYQFFGFMVQCLNEYPRVKDTSDSFYRRQLFIPFDKCFTGRARKYIKDDYLNRPEVLEYVLFKVLNMDYYELSEPESCKAVLADYKEYNNPISQFVEEVLPETRWGVLPFTFLYDLYKEWFAQNCPSGKVQGRNTFNKDIADMAQAGKLPGFTCLGRKVTIRPKNLMDDVEPLIVQYNLTNWMNPNYKGPDIKQICRPVIKATYRGLVRMGYEKDVMMPPSTTQASGNELEILHNVNNEVR